jgi:hypothetical protein
VSQETIRICGYRKVGGTYLVGPMFTKGCDRLPFPIHRCPTCQSGIKFSRGFQWLNWYKYAGNHNPEGPDPFVPCLDDLGCYICHPGQFGQPYGLLWVGQEYTPQSFISEAMKLGVSKRVPAKPRNVKVGTVVLLAHGDAANGIKSINPYEDDEDPEDINKPKNHPGIFAAFRVTAIEKLIWEHEADEDTLKKLEGQGITPVIIKDGETDHNPDVSNDFTPEERAMHELNDLKNKILKH